MPLAFLRKKRFSIPVIIAILLVIVLEVWILIAGPITVLRILRYGDTDIDDHSHYPGRELVASATPFVFEQRDVDLQLDAALRDELETTADLERLLEEHDTIAFLIVHDDAIVFERYFQEHSAAALSQAFSMTKSLFSVLVGMAIEDGYLAGVDQAITDFVPELAEHGFDNVRIRHLLTMTSGSNYVEDDNPFGEHVILNYTPQLEREILRFETEDTPGATFRYKSGDNALLALGLARALGDETITSYAQRKLWTPLGMEHGGIWTTDRKDGLEKTWCCLAATARDFAKFGRLLLRQGAWNGEQLLSPEWIADSTLHSQLHESAWPADYRAAGWRSYSYQWWLASQLDRDFFALGKDGQFLYVNPRHEVIIVRLGWSSGELYSSAWIRLFQSIARQL